MLTLLCLAVLLFMLWLAFNEPAAYAWVWYNYLQPALEHVWRRLSPQLLRLAAHGYAHLPRPIKRLYCEYRLSLRPRPKKPPTREETAKAQNYANVAASYLLDDAPATNDWYRQMQAITNAGVFLNKARALDGAVAAQRTDKEGAQRVWSLDELAFEILFHEGCLHRNAAEARVQELLHGIGKQGEARFERWHASVKQRDQRAALHRARTAFEKALRYRPHSLATLRELTTVYRELGNYRGARLVIQKALELAPNNVENIKLAEALK